MLTVGSRLVPTGVPAVRPQVCPSSAPFKCACMCARTCARKSGGVAPDNLRGGVRKIFRGARKTNVLYLRRRAQIFYGHALGRRGVSRGHVLWATSVCTRGMSWARLLMRLAGSYFVFASKNVKIVHSVSWPTLLAVFLSADSSEARLHLCVQGPVGGERIVFLRLHMFIFCVTDELAEFRTIRGGRLFALHALSE